MDTQSTESQLYHQGVNEWDECILTALNLNNIEAPETKSLPLPFFPLHY